jgi:hypothetical protein
MINPLSNLEFSKCTLNIFDILASVSNPGKCYSATKNDLFHIQNGAEIGVTLGAGRR